MKNFGTLRMFEVETSNDQSMEALIDRIKKEFEEKNPFKPKPGFFSICEKYFFVKQSFSQNENINARVYEGNYSFYQNREAISTLNNDVIAEIISNLPNDGEIYTVLIKKDAGDFGILCKSEAKGMSLREVFFNAEKSNFGFGIELPNEGRGALTTNWFEEKISYKHKSIF